jgi:hypothetical protein
MDLPARPALETIARQAAACIEMGRRENVGVFAAVSFSDVIGDKSTNFPS